MGLVCHYRTPARPVPQTAAKDEQVARMEGRLQAMEAMLKAALGAGVAEHNNNYAAHAPAEDDHSRTFINITTPVSIEDIQPAERGPGSTRDTDCISSAGEAVDGMAAISFRDEEGSGYFGEMLYSPQYCGRLAKKKQAPAQIPRSSTSSWLPPPKWTRIIPALKQIRL